MDFTPILGLAQPANGETGWGDEVNANVTILENRIVGDGNITNVKDFGAVGDGTTDDATAIQAALDYSSGDTGADAPAITYFPPGFYRIGEPMHLGGTGGRILQGCGVGYRGGTRGTIISCTGSATQILLPEGANGITIRDIVFEENEAHFGDLNAATDTAIDVGYVGDYGGSANWRIEGCNFAGMKYAIDASRNNWLINSVQNCNFASRLKISNSSFVNYNSFINCNFQAIYEPDEPQMIISGHNWTFVSCRWESTKRQALVLNGTDDVLMLGTYLEDINRDGAMNPLKPAERLPAIDLQTSDDVSGHNRNFKFIVGSNFAGEPVFGCSAVAGTSSITGVYLTGMAVGNFDYQWYESIHNDLKVNGARENEDVPVDNFDTSNEQLRLKGLRIYPEAGSPESVVTSNVGALFIRTDGGAGTTLYTKATGTGNTGWRPIPVGGTSAYSTSNVSTDRSYDANSTTTDELADVLGTLIADLKANGVIT